MVVVAMVASMCITTAVPALALDTIIKNLQVAFTPTDASKPATINISFTTTTSLGSGVINIELPDECYVPGGIAPSNIKVNGSSCSSVTITDHTLTIDPASYIGANAAVTVEILEAAGILTPLLSQEKNLVYDNAGTRDDNLHPAVAALNAYLQLYGDTAVDALYDIEVWTSADILHKKSDKFEIFDWLEMDRVEFGQDDIINVTGAGFTPGDTLTLNKDMNRPLIGSGVVNADGTVNIQAVVSGSIPMVPFQGTDEHGRASDLLWPRYSLITDAVWMISLAGYWPFSLDPADRFCQSVYHPEGAWWLMPSVDVTVPVLPASQIVIMGRDWGEVNDILVGGPINDPIQMPELADLDDDCYCDSAIFNVPGLFSMDLFMGGDITWPGTVVWTCDDLDEPVGGPGCADDFLVELPVPRNIPPGAYEVTVEGYDQLKEIHVAGEGAITAMGLGIPLTDEWDTCLNQLTCFVNDMLTGPLTHYGIIPPGTPETLLEAGYTDVCCQMSGTDSPCALPQCQFDFPDCTGAPVTVIAEFEVPEPALVVTPATICKGGTVSLAGSGFVPGEDFGRAVIASSPQEIASGITVDGQGNFLKQNVNIPMGISTGTHTVTVFFDLNDTTYDGPGDPDEISASVTVVIFDCGSPTTCNLTTSSTEGGSVIIPGEGIYPYACGTVVAIVAEASPNYEFSGWTGNTATIVNPGSPDTTITMNDHYSITANFELSGTATCSLTVISGTCGQVATPGTGAFDYPCGTNVPIEVGYTQPCNCCEFTGWAGDIATVDDADSMSTSILMDGNYTIEAQFVFEWCPWVYDGNANCEVDYPEMIDALMDYLTEKITFGQMIDVLMEYLTP